MKFKVNVTDTSKFTFVVEADSYDEAIEAALSGDLEPTTSDFWGGDVTDVYKLED